MCVIAASPAGTRQPNLEELYAMWLTNPHGAGYMVARKNRVEIHKGFMDFNDFWRAVSKERFSDADPVVYHFRISTQAGINPEMTHPFPLTANLDRHKELNLTCSIGIAHNGIISLTANGSREYSDTSLFISRYMTQIIRRKSDLENPKKLDEILSLAKSKFCILSKDGAIKTIGGFIERDGILLSNGNHLLIQSHLHSIM